MTDADPSPESFDDVEDEAADTVEDHDSASIFTKKEILLTLKDRFRAKDQDIQQQFLDNYRAMSRRDFLKLLGFTMGGAAVVGGSGWLMGKKVFSDHTDRTLTGMQGGGGYDTVKASGQTINIGDGETYQNVLIDLTTGSGVTLYPRHSTNWTIRNVGLKGYNEASGFRVSVSDAGNGASLIECLYMGDGSAKVGDFVHGPGAIFMGPEHSGQLTFRYCNVQGYPNNGFYCSNGPGTVTFDTCFGKNNGVSTFRCKSRGDKITNCVAYNDNTEYGWYQRQNDYAEENGRPVWAWTPAGMTIQKSHFKAGPYPSVIVVSSDASPVQFESGAYSGSITGPVNVGSEVGNTPVIDIPAGIPTDAEMAASGNCGDSAGGSDDAGDTDTPDTGDGTPNTDDDSTDSVPDIEPC